MSKLSKIMRQTTLILFLILRGGFLLAQSDSLTALLVLSEQNLRSSQFDNSLKQAQRAYELARTEGSVWGQVEAMRFMGANYRINERLPEAENAYQKAVQLFEKTNFRERYARCLGGANGRQNEAASAYITKFSRLVRLVLENSRSEWITLEQELETLTLYLDIEQMRFNSRFQYWINLENDFDTEGVKLPPMLIQPYVENAIWHGLMHKEGEGNVTISILEKADNQLEINILDDGIGRQKAMELRSKTATQRKSFGMEISADRLNIINQIYKVNAQVFIHDLTDETTGLPSGTRVQLVLAV